VLWGVGTGGRGGRLCVAGDAADGDSPLFLCGIGPAGVVIDFCQHQPCLHGGFDGEAGFQIVLRFAPKLLLRGQFAQTQQQACVFRVALQPCIGGVYGFLLFFVVQIAHAGGERRQQGGIAAGGGMFVYPCDCLVVQPQIGVFLGDGGIHDTVAQGFGDAFQAGFHAGGIFCQSQQFAVGGFGSLKDAGMELLGAGDIADLTEAGQSIAAVAALDALPVETLPKALDALDKGAAQWQNIKGAYEEAGKDWAAYKRENPNKAMAAEAAWGMAQDFFGKRVGGKRHADEGNRNTSDRAAHHQTGGQRTSGGNPALPNDPYHPDKVENRKFEGRRDFGLPTDNHSVVNGSSIKEITHTPYSSIDLHDSDGLKQRRYFGKDGKVVEDIDYRHTDSDKSHIFPHRHDWEEKANGKPNRIKKPKPHGIEGLDR